MLGAKGVMATLAVKDIDAANKFYEETLGLEKDREMEGWTQYKLGANLLGVYPSQFAGTNEATGATIEVDDLEAAVKDLRSKGVKFEEYDFPGLKTVDGIADTGGEEGKAAWFKDPSGNILALTELPKK